jgi:large subunit ribosomal protein L17
MRHGKKFNHLGRQQGHRRALLKNLSIALIEHKRINTTLAKAKALRVHIEPLITKSKTNSTHSRRVVFRYLQNKFAVQELFDVIAAKIADRPGGYLRIIKTGFRKGDGAEMAMIEFVDYNDVFTNEKGSEDTSSKKSRRSRRGKKAAAVTTETVVENEGDDDPELAKADD